jgi:serine phosphatase RsbU (regulator of sigma subunit)
VTGLLVRIDLPTATAAIVNAGHPPPLRVREGRVEQIPLKADPPFGTEHGRDYRVQALPLAVGDRLIFVTDGMLERDAADVNIGAILTAGMDMHAREAVQHLTEAVLQASRGQLRDDATALCLDWHGGPPRDRDATSGADREGRLDQASSDLTRG